LSELQSKLADGFYAGPGSVDTTGMDFGDETQGEASGYTSTDSDEGVADIDADSDEGVADIDADSSAELPDLGAGDDKILQQYEEEKKQAQEKEEKKQAQEKELKDQMTKAATNRSMLVLGVASLITAGILVYVARSNK
jgi:hypothetical protein